MPNQGIDNGLAPTDATVPQGIFQVNVFARPGAGIIGINTLAGQIKALYPKTRLSQALCEFSVTRTALRSIQSLTG